MSQVEVPGTIEEPQQQVSVLSLGASLGSEIEKRQRILAVLWHMHHGVGPEEVRNTATGASIGFSFGELLALTPLYKTPPMGEIAQNSFINAAALVRTSRSPHDQLDALHALEALYGRVRGQRWQDRTLDLDLLYVQNGKECVTSSSSPSSSSPIKSGESREPSFASKYCHESWYRPLSLPHKGLWKRPFMYYPFCQLLGALRLSIAPYFLPAEILDQIENAQHLRENSGGTRGRGWAGWSRWSKWSRWYEYQWGMSELYKELKGSGHGVMFGGGPSRDHMEFYLERMVCDHGGVGPSSLQEHIHKAASSKIRGR